MLTNKITWFCFGYFGFAALYFICAWFITGGAFAAYELELGRVSFVMMQLTLGILAGALSAEYGYGGYIDRIAERQKQQHEFNDRWGF